MNSNSARPSHRLPASLRPALLAVILAGCSSAAQEGRPPMPPAEVATVTVEPHEVPLELAYPARVFASREVEIRPRVSGILERRNFIEGARVRRGQSLYQIDPVPHQSAAARAEAQLAAAEARLAQARRESARLAPLVAAKAAGQRELDDARSAAEIADAEARAARASLREARLNLEYARVESPIDGIAGRSLPSEGSLLAGPQTLLTTVTQIDPAHVRFGLSDSEQLELRREAAAGRVSLPEGGRFRVQVTLADGTALAEPGQLDFTEVGVDPATGTREARALVPNAQGLLRPGQFVRVRLEGALRRDAVEVPQRAVLEGPQGRFVYVVEEGKAAVRPVELAHWRGDQVVVTGGLAAGERVIVDGVLKIGPGAPVHASDTTPGR